jgi:predicted MFS family arabinose efflux permease
MRAAQLSLGVNLSSIGLLAGLDDLRVWQILAFSIVSGTIRAIYQPVRLSFTYDLVGRESAVSGLALMQLVNLIGQGTGALIAGSAMERLGPAHGYGLLACMHLAGFIVLGFIRAAGGSSPSGKRESLGQTFRNYAREVRTNRTLLALVIVTGAVNLFGFTFVVVLPELATGRWGVGAEGLGVLHAARATGGMLAMGAVTLFGSGTRHGALFIGVMLAFGASLSALAFAPSYLIACLALLLVAAMAALTDVLSQTMMQHCVADQLRGRAMGAWMFAVGLSPLGQVELGALAAWWGADLALASSGVALIACGLAARLASRLRRL